MADHPSCHGLTLVRCAEGEVRRAGGTLEDDLVLDHEPEWNRRVRDPQGCERKYPGNPQAGAVRLANHTHLHFLFGLQAP